MFNRKHTIVIKKEINDNQNNNIGQYLHAISPSVWIIVCSMLIVVLGFILWCCLAIVPIVADCKVFNLDIPYIAVYNTYKEELPNSKSITISENTYDITSIKVASSSEINELNETILNIDQRTRDLETSESMTNTKDFTFYKIETASSIPIGCYSAAVNIDYIKPIQLLFRQ